MPFTINPIFYSLNIKRLINLVLANVHILDLLKSPENQTLSGVSQGHKIKTVENGLNSLVYFQFHPYMPEQKILLKFR